MSLSRLCSYSALRTKTVPSQVRSLFRLSIGNCVRNEQLKNQSVLFVKSNLRGRPNLNIFRSTATTATQLKSHVSKNGQKAVGYWLLGCSGMILVAVVLGGITRLTESGLSMVTWRLMGEKMPRTAEEWEREFKRYQEYPEFKIKNKELTLEEFKFIWHMEYGHRMWGRAIGAVFLVPALYFWTKGRFTPGLKKRVVAFGTLILSQGLMGWYMVKSGLEDRFHGESDVPRVSQYRLAVHLGLAFILYTLFLWSALDVLVPAQTVVITSRAALKAARKFRMLAHCAKGMVFLTAISGAFVAGLDAGLVYNSFPKMADRWIPDDILALSPTLVNFTENPTTVQFNHRVLAITTLLIIAILWGLSRNRVLPSRAYLASSVLGALAYVQVSLGISTLLSHVPTSTAAMHQTGSLALLSTAVWLTHELKKLPK